MTKPAIRCQAEIYKKDCYRRTGRGPGGFSMHYQRSQCSRKAKGKTRRCWQHQDESFIDYRHAMEFMESE